MTIQVQVDAQGNVSWVGEEDCELCYFQRSKRVPAMYDAIIPRRCKVRICEHCYKVLPDKIRALARKLKAVA